MRIDDHTVSYEHEIDSDLQSAIEENPDDGNLKIQNIDKIVAAVYGENDGNDWYWILKMKDGTHGLAQGGCDYTGWECQSYLNFTPTKTALQAAKLAPQDEAEVAPWNDHRLIQKWLIEQLKGTRLFGVVDGV